MIAVSRYSDRSEAGSAASQIFHVWSWQDFSIQPHYDSERGIFMSYYRDVYLKSEEWQTLRNKRLELANFACELCRCKHPEPDVHHLEYKRLYNVDARFHLRALCRTCHNRVHALMKKYPKLKKLKFRKQWRIVRSRLSKISVTARFTKARNFLVKAKRAKRKLMRFHQACYYIITPDPEEYLKQYCAFSGIEPRFRKQRRRPIPFTGIPA
jgi:hypothetical protein